MELTRQSKHGSLDPPPSQVGSSFTNLDPMAELKKEEAVEEPIRAADSATAPPEPWRVCRIPREEDMGSYGKYFKVMSFLFSHVGLTFLVMGYTVMGGFLFKFLEGKSEIVERETISKKRKAFITKIWLMTLNLDVLEQGNWSVSVEKIMKDFQEAVVDAIKLRGWDGRDEKNKDISWSFFGALLYSVTVLTTIGYGHIAPKTHWGRMSTILYALLGIPLTLLCLSTIGNLWAKCFRFLYKYVSLSLGRLFTCKKDPAELQRKSLFKEAMNTKGVTVPLWVSLLIMGGYIGGGAILFSLWQKEWDYLVAAYFCFITLSTIGFGDYVFGFGSEANDNSKLITSSIYLFMGLSIIAMCFNLMQEEVKSRFMRIGLKLGLIQPKQKKKRRLRSSTR